MDSAGKGGGLRTAAKLISLLTHSNRCFSLVIDAGGDIFLSALSISSVHHYHS